MDKLLEAIARLIEAVKPLLAAFVIAMGVRADERAKQRLREAEEELQARKRVDAAPDADGLPLDAILAELNRRKQRRGM